MIARLLFTLELDLPAVNILQLSFPRSASERTASRRSCVAGLASRECRMPIDRDDGVLQNRGIPSATQERREAGRSHAERGNEVLVRDRNSRSTQSPATGQ